MSHISQDHLISVVMPVYNREELVRLSIESILNQTYNNWELIIVNDASTDNTAQIIDAAAKDSDKIKTIHLSDNIGPSGAANRGLQSIQGDYFTIHDSDDISHPDRFRKMVQYLETHPEINLLGSNIEIIDADGKKIATRNYPQTDDEIRKFIRHSCPFLNSSVLMRTSLIQKLGGYNETLRSSSEVDLWYRAIREFKAANLPFPLVQYRISHSQETSDVKATLAAVLKIQSKYIFTRPYFSAMGVLFFLLKYSFRLLPAKALKAIFWLLYYKRVKLN
jgi:glycosyltransferase involved in cell wall biosynthesis